MMTESYNAHNPKPVWRDVEINAQALSLFRILFSLLLLYDLFVYVIPYWDFIYSIEGVFMASERITDLSWSILRYSDNPFYQFSIVGVYVLALLGLLTGYRTRLCAFIGFLAFKVLLDRNPATDSGAEVLETCFLLWCCFMPMDTYWSFAAASRGNAPRRTRWPIIPVIALKGQILLVYLCSGLYKVASDIWLNGEAITYALSDGIFGTPTGEFITGTLLPDFILVAACWGVIILQLSFSPLVYLPVKTRWLRLIVLVAAAAMHIGFIWLMQIHLFPFLSLFYLILLFPDEWITKMLKKRRARLSKIKIYYDPDCTFCKRTAFLLKEFCLAPLTPVMPSDSNPEAHALLQEHYSWVVYGSDGNVYMKWPAVSYVLKQSPVFFLFGYLTDLPVIRPFMNCVYHAIGRNRNILGKISHPFLKERHDGYLDRTQQFICLFLFSIAASYAIWAIPQIKKPIPKDLVNFARQTGVIQSWDLFAPSPVAYSYAFTIKALDEKREAIPITQYLQKHFRKDGRYYDFYSPRLVKYYAYLFVNNAPRHRKGYARYLCWQLKNAGTPAYMIDLNFSYKHNFRENDQNEISVAYRCDNIMRRSGDP